MSGKPFLALQQFLRFALAGLVALTLIVPPTTSTVTAASGDRTLYLYHTHTKETGRFTFKRNGQYDQSVLKQLNVFLADWRTKEPTKMDPALFDLLWAVYQEVGGREPISIVSSYRSPKTNAMLARKSSGVADNSQHMKGKAIDFYIPGVNLTRLREVAMSNQVGGVGYYPTSGSPFVHLDTGSVRAWPRMTRAQLKRVFPDGKTLHLPTDGKPLSAEGRRYAEAEWKKCRAVPCNGALTPGPTTMLASLDSEPPIPLEKPKTLLGLFFGDEGDEAGEPAPPDVRVASLGGDPAQRVVSTIDFAPLPLMRPSIYGGGVAANGAPIPAQKSDTMLLATLGIPVASTGTALAALDDALGAPVPRPRLHMTNPPADMVTAYVDPVQDPEAQLALKMIIERETTASLPRELITPRTELIALEPVIETASISPDAGTDPLEGMFDLTFRAVGGAAPPESMARALADLAQSRQPNDSITARGIELVAPELDHVADTLVHPVFMSAGHFAVMTEAEGYLDKGTELGPLTGRIGFRTDPEVDLNYDHFVVRSTVIVR